MDHPTRRRGQPPRPVWLATVLVVALLATFSLAPDQARTTVQAAARPLAGWLRETMWTWPLAAALTLAALTSPPARRRWPRPTQRIAPAIGLCVLLVALASPATVSRPRVGVLALGAVVAVGLLAAGVLVLPRRLAPPVPAEVLGRLSDHDRLEAANARVKLQNDLRTTALQAIAGLAVLAGAVLGFQQLTEDRRQATATQRQAIAAQELTRQGQASERFTRAIDQLGSDRLEVQLGGIYGLEQIAQQAPDNRLAVTEVLVAYLHRTSPRPAKPPSDTSRVEELRIRVPDAQAALTVLGRRKTASGDPPLDLQVLDVRGADLIDADLRGADLRVTDLSLSTLRDADLRDANLGGANLFGVDLTTAKLSDADLQDADLREANLHGTEFIFADLRRAKLSRAYLSHANLHGASLQGANLRGVDLQGANLYDANLGDADLQGADLHDATASELTAWPDGFNWQGAGVRLETSPRP